MVADSFQFDAVTSMKEAFPECDPGIAPLGGRVLVQIRRTANKTRSGLVLVQDTKETVKWNTQTAKIVALGPLAYRNRETAQDWPEGQWVKVGDFVRAPRWGGDRHEVIVDDGDPVVFAVFNDHEIISKITGNPLDVKAYIL